MKKLATLICLSTVFSTCASASWYVKPSYLYSSSTDVKGSSVQSSTRMYGIEAGNENVTLGYRSTKYTFDKMSDMDTLNLLYGDVHKSDRLNNDWGYFVGSYVSFGFTDNIELTKSYTVAPRGGFTYYINDEWSVDLGAIAVLNKARNLFSPLIKAKYRDFSDYGWSAIIGPSSVLNYRFNQIAAVGVRGSIVDSKTSIVDGGHYYIHSSKMNMIEKGKSLGAYASITPFDHVGFIAGVNYEIDRKMDFYNHRDKMYSIKFDDNVNFYVQGTASF